PVGAFLSGGVDSSLITAIMCRASKGKVKTFSIGFQGARAGLDESSHARAVARYLGTEHYELILPADVLSKIDDLFEALDEPIADSAILPTLLLSRFARKHVKVVLTGEGADELFAGYNRYKAAYLSDRVKGVPAWGRGAAAAIARRLGRGRIFSDLPHRGVGAWAKAFAHSADAAHANILDKEFLNKSARVDPWEWLKNPEEPASLAAAQAFDLRTVLCDSLLMKVDKSTMRAGLEARVPYLDRRLVEYAIQLPNSTKIRRLKGKYALRRLAKKYLPRPIAWRKKHGFVVPWEEWIRDPGSERLDAFVRSGAGPFDRAHLQWMRDDLKAGGGQADAGLFFRAAVLGLWLESLPRPVRC
ncbi:MAG: asparagine synthase C-terminal domain-containing protein, partial [Elusimicrobiota bacterium]